MGAENQRALPWRVRLLYGAGDFGLVLTMQLAGLMLLFFFTEVLGIPPAVAGALILAGLVFDAITDVAMGVLADRMRRRLQGYRPWLLIGAPILAVATALLFFAPAVSGAALFGFVVLTQFFYRGAFTVAAIPFVSLSSALTQDSRERSILVGVRLSFTTFASLLVATLAQPMVAGLGQGDDQAGFFRTAAVVGGVGGLCVLLAWSVTRGWEHRVAPEPYRLKALPGMVARNGPFLVVASLIMCQQGAQAFVLTGAPYFFSYARGEPETLGLSLGVLIGGVGVFVPVWTVLIRRIGKRQAWLIGSVVSALGLGALAALSQAPLPLFLGAMGLSAFGFAALALTAFAMLPDTVEYGEWVTGRRAEAALVSALTFSQKCAMGAASFGVGLLLSASGHTAAAPMTGAGAGQFGVLIFALPAVLAGISFLIALGYPLSTALHGRLVRALAWRRRRRAQRLGFD